ncbi:hypothetical protein [Vibrio owensii]|uniref:hypothetical protein n=1 Tax=Vibrio harveyi group TaxID=717610 RepID=UPI003CC6CEA7
MHLPLEVRLSAVENFKAHAKGEGHQSTTARTLYQIMQGHDVARLAKSFNGCHHATARALANAKIALTKFDLAYQLRSIKMNKKGLPESVVGKNEDIEVAFNIFFGESEDQHKYVAGFLNKIDLLIHEITTQK